MAARQPIWHRPLVIADFVDVPPDTCIDMHYNSTNQGRLLWTHKAISEDGKRLIGTFDGIEEEGAYLYQFRGHVCRGSGAEPCWNIRNPPKWGEEAEDVNEDTATDVVLVGETWETRRIAEAFPFDFLTAISDRPLRASDFEDVPRGAVVQVFFRGRVEGMLWWRHWQVHPRNVEGHFCIAPFKPSMAFLRHQGDGFTYEDEGPWSGLVHGLQDREGRAPLQFGLSPWGDPTVECWSVPERDILVKAAH
mmetsp:Transcript_70313/g.165510  ORF Transcript_70313/g.165510 Transcript_70313/m.165510 type:complete len:249 (-) Transcript_70313:55-801(-)